MLRAASVEGSAGVVGVNEPATASAAESPRRLAIPRHRFPGWTAGEIGESVEGRQIERLDSRPERIRRHVAVVCGTHGDERAAADLCDGFGRIERPDDLHLTIIPRLNPDGWAKETRRNAREVDLNRNFPWGWPARTDSGSGPASEPETQAVMSFLQGARPDLVVWVHQPLNYVAAIADCPRWYADIWSAFSGVPVRRNLAQIGGGESWAGRELGIPSMLVEVGGTREEPVGVSAHTRALEALLYAVLPT